MTNLLLAAIAFLVLHAFPSTPGRAWAIKRLGEPAYLGLFSFVSVAVLAWMIWAYQSAPAAEPLWITGETWRWINAGLMLAPFILIVSAVAQPNPSAVRSEGALERPEPWRGIFAVTRHPLMWGIAIWALLHLITRPDLPGLVFFAALGGLALGGAALQDVRKRRELGAAWETFESHTSMIPFAAVAAGTARLSLKDVGLWRLLAAVFVWMAMLHFHTPLFGVPAIPV